LRANRERVARSHDLWMHLLDLQDWREHVVLTRDIPTPGERSAFYSAFRQGRFVQMHRGIYMPSTMWLSLDDDARYRARVLSGMLGNGAGAIASHDSASALWRLPVIGERPDKIHLMVDAASGGRSNAVFIRHVTGVPDETETIQGVRVTHLARTVVDVAATRSFAAGVVAADAALRRTTHPHPDVPRTFLTLDDLRAQTNKIPLRHGLDKASRVVEFANGLADRPGESLSRVSIHQLRLTAPELQVPLQGASGRWYTVDFWWPEFNHIGEFDGLFKYSDPRFLRGRTPEQALIDEKLREDDLRAAPHGMSRWGWDVARSLPRLRSLLVAAGIR